MKRNVEGGIQVIRGSFPALLTLELDFGKPRRGSLPLLIRSLRADIAAWNGQALQADPRKLGLKGSPTWVRRIFSPPAKEGGPKFDGREDLQTAVEHSLTNLLSDSTFADKLLSRWMS